MSTPEKPTGKQLAYLRSLVFARPAARPASEAQIAALQDEHGALLPPDGEG